MRWPSFSIWGRWAFSRCSSPRFLIYQASYSNIARRRRERERLAAIGVGSGTLDLLFVAEGALIGLAGALIGTLLGAALAGFLVSMESFALSAIAVAKGVFGGVGAGVIGAAAATRQATAQRPTGGPRWIVAGLAAILFAVAAMSDTLAAAFWSHRGVVRVPVRPVDARHRRRAAARARGSHG